MLATEKFIHDENIGPGDEVVLIGRFINIEGKERNIPSVRFGHISQMPIEPLEYEGKSQESFLCEIKSIGGFSGSPVFLAPVSDTGRPEGSKFVDEARFWESIGATFKTLNIRLTIMAMKFRILVLTNTGMMGVVPAWKLDGLLDFPREKELRDMAENEKSSDVKLLPFRATRAIRLYQQLLRTTTPIPIT